MRRGRLFVFVACLAASFGTAAPSQADHLPAVVIPGRPDVPVIINGRNASYAVIEGDWGLTRPGAVYPEIYGGWNRGYYGYDRGYFPMTGRRPVRGRQEVIPSANRALPPPAQPFHREWSTQSPPEFGGADYVSPVPRDPPAVVIGPGFRGPGFRDRESRLRPREHNPRRWHPRAQR